MDAGWNQVRALFTYVSSCMYTRTRNSCLSWLERHSVVRALTSPQQSVLIRFQVIFVRILWKINTIFQGKIFSFLLILVFHGIS